MVNGIFNFHDMSTKPQILTGHTDIVRQYLTDEERAKLAPGQLAPEQRTEDGKVLHTVEVLTDYERFGRVSTECFTVQIPECPELEPPSRRVRSTAAKSSSKRTCVPSLTRSSSGHSGI